MRQIFFIAQAVVNLAIVLTLVGEMVLGDGNVWLEPRAAREAIPAFQVIVFMALFAGNVVAIAWGLFRETEA